MVRTKTTNSASIETRRIAAGQKRQAPRPEIPHRLIVRSNGEQRWVPSLKGEINFKQKHPGEILVHLEGSDFQTTPVVKWNIEKWLETVLDLWSDREIELYFVSFNLAVVRTNLIEHLGPLDHKNHRWQIKLLTDGKELTSTANINRLLCSCFNEIHIYVAGIGDRVANTHVLDGVKDMVDLRRTRKQNQPLIVFRLCPADESKSKLISEVSHWAKQVDIDRTDVIEKQSEEKRLWGL